MWVLAFQRTVRIPSSPTNATVAVPILSLPFDSFKICVYSRHRKLEISYTMISLVYGRSVPKLAPFPHRYTDPFLGRSARVFCDTAPAGSVGDPTVWCSGFTGHDSERRDEILLRHFYGTFRPRHDPLICSSEFDNAFCQLQRR